MTAVLSTESIGVPRAVNLLVFMRRRHSLHDGIVTVGAYYVGVS